MLLSLVMAKYFIRPMDDLRNAMIKMQEGDLEVRLNQQNLFYEFQLLNRNFDQMAEKIKELKIEVYENQLEKQNVEIPETSDKTTFSDELLKYDKEPFILGRV